MAVSQFVRSIVLVCCVILAVILLLAGSQDSVDALMRYSSLTRHSSTESLLTRLIESRHVFLEIFFFMILMKLSTSNGSVLMAGRRKSTSSRIEAEEEDLIYEEVCDIFGRKPDQTPTRSRVYDLQSLLGGLHHGF